jgi:ABC-type proline/glycine betaine transport system permease subunit
MELLASLFVGKPQNILAVAVVFLAGYLLLRFTALGLARHPQLLLIASTAWGLYAAWEWLVKVMTPEANIRVDLLVMWPVLAILSAWALFRTFR